MITPTISALFTGLAAFAALTLAGCTSSSELRPPEVAYGPGIHCHSAYKDHGGDFLRHGWSNCAPSMATSGNGGVTRHDRTGRRPLLRY